ncbi:MAG: nucleotidyltransferase family protein [Acidobacteriota bacterium]|nr:nucleotidyltransferase family protein [Acidobacteriota bacterium]
MRRSGFRFRPPRVEIGADLSWVLLRAFGPLETPLPHTLSAPAVLELARQFEIANRIGARHSATRLSEELDPATALQFAADKRQSEFVTLQRRAAIRDVARIAESLDVKLGLLKFIALDSGGVLIPGGREAADIDILVAEDRSRELHARLAGGGYMARDVPATEHHLPTLDHPKLGAVEVHTFIPGVHLAGQGATLEVLGDAGLLSPVDDLPGTCLVPDSRLLTAHGLVHGIAQHGRHPDAYPSARMIADLLDLGLADRMGDDDLAVIESWIELVVSRRECAAVRMLCCWLSQGAAHWSEDLHQDSDAGLLLRHLVAGTLDRQYRESLNLGFFTPGLSQRSSAAALGSVVRQTLFPSRGQLDKIYGSRTSSAGYVVRRLSRPVALAGRFLRYTTSRLLVRLRRARE